MKLRYCYVSFEEICLWFKVEINAYRIVMLFSGRVSIQHTSTAETFKHL